MTAWEKFILVRKAMNNDAKLLEQVMLALSEEELDETLDWIAEQWELKVD